MFDYVLKWATVSDARADVSVAVEMLPDDQSVKQWLQDHCIAGVQVWRNSQDTVDGSGNVVHNYMAGYFAIVSLNNRKAAIENDASMQLGVDREKMNAGQPGFIVCKAATITAPLLLDIRFAPVFMGMNVPWGGLN